MQPLPGVPAKVLPMTKTNTKQHIALAASTLVLALVVLGAWSEAQAPFAFIPAQAEPDPSIIFVGDIMLDRNVARHAAEASPEALFAGVLDLFAAADARVANLEGTITTNPSIAQVDNTILHFTFDPGVAARALQPLGLSAVSLANNHAYDFGSSGYRSTQWYLENWGIQPFGHPSNASSSLSTAFYVRDKGFCFAGYHSLYDPSTSEVVQIIKTFRANDCYRVVVFAHWGDEYEPVANAQQVSAAHEFIDAGADLVIGAHPHVVQNVEEYKGRAIFYSLGNFMFDQNFSWATQHGLAVKVTFKEASTAFELTPVSVIEEEVKVAEGADKQRVLGAAGRLAEFILP
ncbi:MAG: polyglutamate synthase CapA [Candidatus Adlerbacteria bacterium]|nr:polyglutamate synthase CapA [Candidatus Adlerbacteria bacterium]